MDTESTQVSRDELEQYLNNSYNLRKATHLGARSSKNGISPIERFMLVYPQKLWSDYVTSAEKKARKKALMQCMEESDLQMAKQEIRRLVNGYEAELTYLGRDPQKIEIIKQQYQMVYHSLKHPAISLDSVCYMKVGD